MTYREAPQRLWDGMADVLARLIRGRTVAEEGRGHLRVRSFF